MTYVVNLECEFRYEAAHWLPNVPDGHQCGRLHGHSYHLTVVVSGAVKDKDGFVCDFADIKQPVKALIDRLDHHCLNDIIENPTVEWQLVWLWQQLEHTVPGLSELRLRETSNNTATYRGSR